MKRRKLSDRGAVAVEMAMVSLLLITLLIAVLEGGRLFFMYANLASAARDAAREVAIAPNAGEAEARAASRADAVYMFGAPSLDTGTQYCPSSPGPGDNATVVLMTTTEMLSGIWDQTFTIRATGVMRCNG